MKLLDVVEILGIFSFAFSGALAAMQKKLDVFGILVLTFVTSIGGGTVRDLIIGSLPVAWLLDTQVILTILISYIISLFFSRIVSRMKHTLFWFDTVGLALFCVVAISKGIDYKLHPLICIALGTITGCFGGIIRDVLLNEIPYVFRKDVYASACMAGGALYFGILYVTDDRGMAGLFSGILILLIRVGAYYRKWRIPDFYKSV